MSFLPPFFFFSLKRYARRYPPCWDELVGAKSGFGAMGRGKQGGLWQVEGGQAFTEETKAKEILLNLWTLGKHNTSLRISLFSCHFHCVGATAVQWSISKRVGFVYSNNT